MWSPPDHASRGANRSTQCLSSAHGRPRGSRPVFDGIRIGRPATGALLDAGYRAIADLPADLDRLLALHGVGPKAVRLLRQARAN